MSLLNIPTRRSPEEVCTHCGAIFRGLFHCQSLEEIIPIQEDIMSMEKRGVVSSEAEKTAATKVPTKVKPKPTPKDAAPPKPAEEK